MSRVAAAAISVALAGQSATACTAIILHAEDGTTVPARTMEFGFNLHSDLVAVPAGTEITTLVMNPKESGFTYETKYGFAGANGFGAPIVVDGMNSEGLYFGVFYFAGPAVMSKLTDDNREHAISSEEMGNWILGQFATVEEVRKAIPSLTVVGTDIEQIGGPAPVHYGVTDASGDSIVIEYTKDGLRIFDNTVNVMTNNPPYDWHLTNLQNYIGLQADNFEEITVGRQTLKPFGQGTGLVGLPGNSTSPSRFVRAVAFANTALPAATADDAIFDAFHILNNFDIPKGSIRQEDQGQVITDYTIWTSASDTKNRVYYYKTYDSQSVESIDVRKVLEGLDKPATLKMETGFVVTDRTSEF
ncbi:choloylglycine hydrolase family protein [Pseudooceanicola sp. HF7]|nr:choloylglycine hydrolase family protein [Pseudooceanicola sp. HF7]NIZ11011.1 choloylglycine hydrolase family protein [Pseudooceanicola sp. HF7]